MQLSQFANVEIAASQVFAAKQAVAEGSLSARNAFASAADRRADGPESPRPDIIVNEDGEAVEETNEVWRCVGFGNQR